MDREIKREIILDNYENPYHKVDSIDKDGYIEIRARNSSCIDNFTIYIKLDNNIILDIYFKGEGCSISTSSTSITIKSIIGKTIDEALDILKNFQNLVNEKEVDTNKLGEFMAFDTISRQANRINCALLPINNIIDALEDINDR